MQLEREEFRLCGSERARQSFDLMSLDLFKSSHTTMPRRIAVSVERLGEFLSASMEFLAIAMHSLLRSFGFVRGLPQGKCAKRLSVTKFWISMRDSRL
ncbi:hypothetical protein GOP47_0020555 [Adiantum capillus-veneris]|uniref:Uncharacterized protein n=1 Tax=Adiantum capillus-veneris TaxID=13818 RepID=A0A9D4U9X6_ADICA|nr:hypothetical protein GOP47_0020555 [Adiantum capillus-veneris]